MSDKTHRIVALVGGVLFAVAAGLLQAHLGASVDKVCEGAMSVLGILGFGVTRPVLGAKEVGKEEPNVIRGQFGGEVK